MRISDWSSDVCSSDLPESCSWGPHRPAQQLRIDCHNDGAQRHEHCPKRRLQQDPPCGENASGERDGDDVVAGGPPKVMDHLAIGGLAQFRSEEHTSELQSLMRISYAVFCFKNKNQLTLMRE